MDWRWNLLVSSVLALFTHINASSAAAAVAAAAMLDWHLLCLPYLKNPGKKTVKMLAVFSQIHLRFCGQAMLLVQ